MQEVKQKVSKNFFYLIAICYATEGIVDVVVSSAWPVIANVLKKDISFIGILVMFYYFGSAVISPNTYKIRKRIGTNYTMVLSQICFSTALGLYIVATNIYIFLLGMFINGMGCGLMEVNASSYVLKAYDVKEESTIYGFWGIGSVLGSTVMALAVKFFPPYQRGFSILIVIMIINIILLLSAKLSWTKQKETLSNDIIDLHSVTKEEKKAVIKISDLIKKDKVVLILICFFLSESVIITLNSLVSTIAVNQGGMIEHKAVVMPIIYFISIFLGRIIHGRLYNNTNVIKVLKRNAFIAMVLLILLCISPVNTLIVCTITTIIGFILGPTIPFLNAYIKEMFNITLLSPLLGYGDLCAVIGTIIISGFTTIIIKTTSIRVVELTYAVMIFIFYLLLTKTEQKRKV